MSPHHHSSPSGDVFEIEQLLEQLQDSFFHNIVLLSRLKDLLAAPEHAAALPEDTAADRHATGQSRFEECKYEEEIAAILRGAARRLAF